MTDRNNLWSNAPVEFDIGLGARAAIGVIALGPDRVGVRDLEDFLKPATDVAVFSTRIPMAEKISPDALVAMGKHLSGAARNIVPGSPLDVLAFSCTSGTAAIGSAAVTAALQLARPGTPVCTPVSAAVKAIRRLKAARIGFLAPYPIATCELVAGFLEENGVILESRVTFGLELDADMNRISSKALLAGARKALVPSIDALFISCTALRTANAVDELERLLGIPVLTSNQVLAWDCLRSSGLRDQWLGGGTLFESY